MVRLVVFVTICITLAFITSLNYFKNGKVVNDRFSFKNEKDAYESKMKELEELKHPRSEHKTMEEGKEAGVPVVVLDTPELENGSKIYNSKCVTCHGKLAEGKKGQNAPKLAGQYDWYIEKQLSDMKNGIRENKIMNPYLKKLTPQDMKDLGNYLSKLPW